MSSIRVYVWHYLWHYRPHGSEPSVIDGCVFAVWRIDWHVESVCAKWPPAKSVWLPQQSKSSYSERDWAQLVSIFSMFLISFCLSSSITASVSLCLPFAPLYISVSLSLCLNFSTFPSHSVFFLLSFQFYSISYLYLPLPPFTFFSFHFSLSLLLFVYCICCIFALGIDFRHSPVLALYN